MDGEEVGEGRFPVEVRLARVVVVTRHGLVAYFFEY